MPELPEVERARKELDRVCVGRVIEQCVCKESGGGPRDGLFDDIVIPDIEEKDVISSLEGKRVVSTHRKGKHMWVMLEQAEETDKKKKKREKEGVRNTLLHPIFHFGMTGSFVIKGVRFFLHSSLRSSFSKFTYLHPFSSFSISLSFSFSFFSLSLYMNFIIMDQ